MVFISHSILNYNGARAPVIYQAAICDCLVLDWDDQAIYKVPEYVRFWHDKDKVHLLANHSFSCKKVVIG